MNHALERINSLIQHFEKIRDDCLDKQAEVRGLLTGLAERVQLAEHMVAVLVNEQAAIEKEIKEKEKQDLVKEIEKRETEVEVKEKELQQKESALKDKISLLGPDLTKASHPEQKRKELNTRRKKSKKDDVN